MKGVLIPNGRYAKKSLSIAAAVVVALLLALIACGSEDSPGAADGGRATGASDSGGGDAQIRNSTGGSAPRHEEYAGPVPSMDRFLKLVPPDAESLIKVDVGGFQRIFCYEIWLNDGDAVDCGIMEVIGLPLREPSGTSTGSRR
ncbi:MAG: hypothetical protein OXI91_13550 [Chloroflexota bacterium]|nr:hypothetical protein [Chloroflexota bacterium]